MSNQTRRAQLSEEEEGQAQEVARAANEAAEDAARGGKGKKTEVLLSDFVEGADLGGAHQPRKGATVTETINGTIWKLAPIDSGAYNAFIKTQKQADKERKRLNRASVVLQAKTEALNKRFAQAAVNEALEEPDADAETTEEVEALIEALEGQAAEIEDSLQETVRAPMQAMRGIVEFCLRDWVRPDKIGLNAATRAALDPSRVHEIAMAAIERYVAGASNARFR